MAKYELPAEGVSGNSWGWVNDTRHSRRDIITADDGESDQTWEPGDTVALTFPIGGGSTSTFNTRYMGTYTHTDGKIYPVFRFPEDGTGTNVNHYVLGLQYPAGHQHEPPQKIAGSIDTDNKSTDKSGVFTVCFFPGTLIDTPSGERRVEELVPGDSVLVENGGSVPSTWIVRMGRKILQWLGFTRVVTVKWLGCQTVSTRFGAADRPMPVRFAAGSPGGGGSPFFRIAT